LTFLLLGAGIGFVAGISPGPVLTLVLTETVRGGWLRGAAIAAGPLLADGPIVVLTFLLLAQLPPELVRGISLVGGAFLLYLAWRALRNSGRPRDPAGPRPAAAGGLVQGLLARWLSPHAYLFWSLVGAPLLLRASQEFWLAPGAFLLGYYSTIVGSNVVLALAIHCWAGLLSARAYRGLLLLTATILAGYGLTLLKGALTA
jgi:threonine/homoserine/homoserine lactone efflux protein